MKAKECPAAVSDIAEESCSVSLLTNFVGVEGNASDADIIDAVKNAGYGAAMKGGNKTDHAALSVSENEELLKDHETPVLKRRLVSSVGFLVVLLYLSMGHMMWGWPLPPFIKDNHVMMGLIQLLLSTIIMVINQKFFISGFRSLFQKSPNMNVALGASADYEYSTLALFTMTDAQLKGDVHAMMGYMHEFHFEAAATKVPIAKIADKVSGIFVPSGILIVVVTLIGRLLAGQTIGFALIRAVSWSWPVLWSRKANILLQKRSFKKRRRKNTAVFCKRRKTGRHHRCGGCDNGGQLAGGKGIANMGVHVVMLTGDNERTAKAIGKQAGVGANRKALEE